MFLVIFIEPEFDHAIAMHCFALFPESVSPRCWTRRMWPWRVKIHATSHCLTNCCQFWQPRCWHYNKRKAMLLMLKQIKSRVVDIGTKQKPSCGHWNKTKAMLLMPEQNKSHVVDAGTKQDNIVDARTKQKPLCWCWNKTIATLLMEHNKSNSTIIGAHKKKGLSILSIASKRLMLEEVGGYLTRCARIAALIPLIWPNGQSLTQLLSQLPI